MSVLVKVSFSTHRCRVLRMLLHEAVNDVKYLCLFGARLLPHRIDYAISAVTLSDLSISTVQFFRIRKPIVQ